RRDNDQLCDQDGFLTYLRGSCRLEDIMERIEAGVTLVPIQTKQKVATPDNTAAAAKENKRRLTRIMIAGVLFAVGLVF
ncbi:hypothetical protein, partial [Desulfosporosinus metallidurans]|uniref:hypothetical protein n=1 Tax=Desulfosporosinus metallidurans TaxID=1888891 RepID=UPI000A8821BD